MRRAIATVGVLFCASVGLRAHQVDEYLQAARLSLSHDRVTLDLDLTAGVAVAPAIIARLDANGDNRISPLEARAYGQSVLSDVVVTLDGQPVAVTLASVEVPSTAEVRDGVGTIQLRAAGTVAGRHSGRRLLHFRNNHRPDVSVYLVNALRSDDAGVQVLTQTRDPYQSEIQIEYSVDPHWLIRAAWLAAGLAGIVVLVTRRVLPWSAHRRRSGHGWESECHDAVVGSRIVEEPSAGCGDDDVLPAVATLICDRCRLGGAVQLERP